MPFRVQPHGPQGGPFFRADHQQFGSIALQPVVLLLQVDLGSRDVVHEHRVISRGEVAEADDFRGLFQVERIADPQHAIGPMLPEVRRDAGAIAVAAEIEGEDGVAFLLQQLGQPLPVGPVVPATRLVQEQNAGRFLTAAGIPGADQLHAVHGGESHLLIGQFRRWRARRGKNGQPERFLARFFAGDQGPNLDGPLPSREFFAASSSTGASFWSAAIVAGLLVTQSGKPRNSMSIGPSWPSRSTSMRMTWICPPLMTISTGRSGRGG